jgi:hypothetical protein
MGITNRMGYDASKSPCDTRYAPPEQVQSFSTRCTESARCPLTFKLSIVDPLSPEQFIDEKEWAKYDVYCVGLL